VWQSIHASRIGLASGRGEVRISFSTTCLTRYFANLAAPHCELRTRSRMAGSRACANRTSCDLIASATLCNFLQALDLDPTRWRRRVG